MGVKVSRVIGVGALVAALVLPGLMAVAGARRAAITEPETIELTLGPQDPDVDVFANYRLRGPEWRKGGLGMQRGAISDQDGTRIGSILWSCIQSKVAWLCDVILTLKDGPYTQQGQVMTSGRFFGFNGESLAIVGGTGAYVNARGQATLSATGDDLLVTLELLP
jgi:hypothetical protein